MMRGTVEFYEDKRGDHRWRLKAGNGEILCCCGQGFSSRKTAEDNFELTRRLLRGLPKRKVLAK
jgi:uncharacterized protein YegP (UPF0339 family)